MQDSIIQCIEDIEKQILDMNATGEGAGEVVDALGLSHMNLSSAGVIAILDMLTEGITPVNADITTAMLGICEAQKKFFFALGGLLDEGAEALGKIETKSAPVAEKVEDEAEAAKAFEEPPAATAEAEQPKDEKTEQPKTEEKPQAKAERTLAPQAISSIRVGTARLDRVIELVGKLMVTYAVIAQ